MEEATENILEVQLPRLKEQMSAGNLRVDNIDVFCEQGVFDLSSTRSILQAGKDIGLNINFHGDELHPMNSAQVSLKAVVRGLFAELHLRENCFIFLSVKYWQLNVNMIFYLSVGRRARCSGHQSPGGGHRRGNRCHGGSKNCRRPPANNGLHPQVLG